MKLRFLFTLLLIPLLSSAQEYDFSYLSGLRVPSGEVMYEMSGSDILVKSLPGNIKNDKIVGNIRKAFGIKKKDLVSTYIDENLPVANRVEVMQTPIEGSEVVTHSVLYILQSSAGTTTGICFTTLYPRNTEFEREFIKEWLIDQFQDAVSDKLIADTLYIGGKMKVLGNNCYWRSPNNVYFRGGQVSWSEFPSLEAAVLNKELNIAKNNNASATILSEEELNVVFNDVPTTATRITYMSNKYISNSPLIVYYVADNIDGHFISCILSNYGINRDDYELNPLLEVFMSIPELPHFARNPFDYPMREEYTEPVKTKWNDRIHLIEMGGSLWIPVGDLSHIFGPSPALHFTLGLPIKEKFAIDLKAQVTIPLRCREFDYFYNNISESTKLNTFVHIGGRFRYQHKLGKDLFLNPYLGVGYNEMSTELETGKSTKKERDYRTFGAIGFSGGLSLRYKRVGLFMEYNYSKYSNSKHIERGFGASGLNIGLYYSL